MVALSHTQSIKEVPRPKQKSKIQIPGLVPVDHESGVSCHLKNKILRPCSCNHSKAQGPTARYDDNIIPPNITLRLNHLLKFLCITHYSLVLTQIHSMERAGEWFHKTGVFGVDMIRDYMN